MNIFVVIVTYNGMQHDWIEKCLTSIKNSSMPATAVVVDNCSSDDTVSYIAKHHPEVVCMPQDKNLGFGQANNKGIVYAIQQKADFVVLLNQDATLHPSAIEEMVSVSDGKSVLSPLHLNATGEKLDEMFRISLNHADGQLLSDLLIGKGLKEYYQAGEICAACWMLPVSVIRMIGGFNPLYFHYGEDNNYYQRMVYHHIPMLLVPKARMYHDRLFYGNPVAHHHKRVHRDMLNIVCDINLSFTKRLFETARAIVRAYAYDMPAKAYRPGGFLKELLWCAGNMSRIRRSRTKEKETGLTWLQTDNE